MAAVAIEELWDSSEYFAYDPVNPMAALNQLGDFIPASARSRIIENLKEKALRPPHNDCGWRLACLAPFISSNPGILDDAETLLLAGRPGRMKDLAMAALVKIMDRKRLSRLLYEYQRIGDEDELARLRFAVAPYLGTDALLSDIAKEGKTKRLRSLARMMEALVTSLNESQLRSFITAATDLAADWWVVEALSDVLLKVDDVQAIDRILSAAREIGPPDLRSRLATRAVERLAKLGLVGVALVTSMQVELEAERWRGLADTAEGLAAVQQFKEAIIVANAIVDREERGRAQAFISLHQARHERLEQALLLARQIESTNWRAWSVAHLEQEANGIGPRSTPERNSVAEQPTEGSSDEDPCVRVLIAKADHKAWSALGAYIHRDNSVCNLADFWRGPIASKGMHFLGYFDTELRPVFLAEIRNLVPFIARFGVREDLMAIDHATRDVGRWWR
jgi:hypothetical protein